MSIDTADALATAYYAASFVFVAYVSMELRSLRQRVDRVAADVEILMDADVRFVKRARLAQKARRKARDGKEARDD